MGVGFLGSAFVKGFDNDGFFTGETALEEEDDFSALEKLWRFKKLWLVGVDSFCVRV